MKKMMTAALSAAVLWGAASANAQDDTALCNTYSAIGEVMASELLDVTMREFIGVAQGTNTALLVQISNSIANAVGGPEMAAMAQLSVEEQELLGEAAGGAAIMMLMEGRAASAEQVGGAMRSQCNAIGASQVINNARQVRAAMAQNMGG